MRFSVAATMIAATNPSVVAASMEDPFSLGSTSKAQGESLARNDGDKSNPIIRDYRTHWTMPEGSVENGGSLPNRSSSKSVLLTNQKTTAETETPLSNENPSDGRFDEDGGELGIISPSRRLRPEEGEPALPQQGPKSDAFDSFTAFDRDRTAFYSICDPTVEDEYMCSRCDTNSTGGTITNFDCQKMSCYEIDSRCPNNMMVVCRYDYISRMFKNEPAGNASAPYQSEKCRKVETRLTKTDREMLSDEENSWDFSYCLRYNIASLPESGEDKNNTCEMEVDGIVCNSCLLETVDFSPPNSTSTDAHKEFCVNFDCGNTLLGYSGRFCNAAGLASRSLDYFVYRSLPCDGGCNLCGEAEDSAQMMMMSFRESDFEPPGLTNNSQYLNIVGLPDTMNCFQTQWDALTTRGLACSDLQASVKSPCGCTPMGAPTPEPATNNTENSTATTDGDTEDESGAMPAADKANLPAFLASLATAWLIGFGFF